MTDNKSFMWASLVHLGSNFWNEEGNTTGREHRSTPCASPVLRFFRDAWDAHMVELREAGVNTLIIDLGEAMAYESHPELAVEGSFTREQMEAEIAKLRGMGFELVPKLNFSSCHDVWLKDYSRMLSTPVYYEVVRDLINEVCELFKPRFIHLGMDEETYSNQKNFLYAVVRNGDLWWHDFYLMVDCALKNGVRPWIWSDMIWHKPEEFLARMPKEVVQSNWYYSGVFYPSDEGFTEKHQSRLDAFELLEKHGFDQVPTGSVWSDHDNFEKLTKYCDGRLTDRQRLLGMMQTTWERIDPDWMHVHHSAADHIRIARAWYESK